MCKQSIESHYHLFRYSFKIVNVLYWYIWWGLGSHTIIRGYAPYQLSGFVETRMQKVYGMFSILWGIWSTCMDIWWSNSLSSFHHFNWRNHLLKFLTFLWAFAMGSLRALTVTDLDQRAVPLFFSSRFSTCFTLGCNPCPHSPRIFSPPLLKWKRLPVVLDMDFGVTFHNQHYMHLLPIS